MRTSPARRRRTIFEESKAAQAGTQRFRPCERKGDDAGTTPAAAGRRPLSHGRMEHIVKERDIEDLSADEQKVLDRSFQSALSEKRVRNVLLSAGMTVAAVVLFSTYGAGVVAITAMSLVIVAVSAVEKISYARELLTYKSLVRSLVHKLEHLQNIESTPMDGHPAERARRHANQESARATR